MREQLKGFQGTAADKWFMSVKSHSFGKRLKSVEVVVYQQQSKLAGCASWAIYAISRSLPGCRKR